MVGARRDGSTEHDFVAGSLDKKGLCFNEFGPPRHLQRFVQIWIIRDVNLHLEDFAVNTALAPLRSTAPISPWTMRWRALLAGALFSAAAGILAISCGSGGGAACAVNGKQCAVACDSVVGCAECGNDGQCSPGAPFCILGQCQQCATNADCGVGQACFPKDHECRTKCTSVSDCGGDQPFCDPNTGACVGCRTKDDCPADRPICEPTRQRCSECATSADCPTAQPICDVARGECRQCLVDADCPAGYLCDDHDCKPGCKTNADCGGDRPTCNTDTGACVGCITPNDCGALAPICRTDGTCVQCLQSSDCTSPGLSRCNGEGACVQCLTDVDCGAGFKCKDSGVCEQK